MARLGLYTAQSDAKEVGPDRLELSLKRTRFGGTLSFYQFKKGKITIGQSDIRKKTEIWNILAPHTYECEEKPAKRKKTSSTASQFSVGSLPPPSAFW